MSTETKPIRRIIHPEVRILDSKNFTCEYIASDEGIDSYNEIVRANGWLFDQFKKNAPFVDSHDYSSIEKQVGKVVDFKIDGNRLVESVQWAADVEKNSLAQLGWQMTAGGYLKAVSVGFYPVAMLSRWDSDPSAFKQQCAELKADPSNVRCIYTKQQQIELSTCIIGANPNALAKALRDGCVTETQVMNIFQDPTDKNDAAAQARGHAAASARSRARRWFLGELERELGSL